MSIFDGIDKCIYDDLRYDFQKVIVKVNYAYMKGCNSIMDPNYDVDCRIIDCFIPAEARIDENKNIIIKYKTCHKYDFYTAYYIYDKDNCPELYDFYDFDMKSTMLMALGILLGYDEANDCLKPFLDYTDENGRDVYRKWLSIDPLYDSFRNADGELLKDCN